MTAVTEQNSAVQITPLDKEGVAQTVKLLSGVFNLAADPVREDVEQSLSAETPAVTFTAVVNEQVVGAIRCKPLPRTFGSKSVCGIFQLAVDPAFRQRGIGHALMRRVEDYIAQAFTAERDTLVLLADETKRNNPSSVFYENMGYKPDFMRSRDEDGMPILMKYVERKPERKAVPALSSYNYG
jgi:GNAT superfamily N-acetyltransferase